MVTKRQVTEENQCLIEANQQLISENKSLRKIQKEHEELESFIMWLNELCLRNNFQFCGIRKITFKHSSRRPCYIGFVLKNKLCLEPQRHYEYTIHGYLSTLKRIDSTDPTYSAILNQWYSEPLVGISNTMELADNYVGSDELKHEGIGSAGMTIIKELAKHLHCTLINGEKQPKKDTPEELAKLTAFYHAHGFDQDNLSRHISFDMKNYQPSGFEIPEP